MLEISHQAGFPWAPNREGFLEFLNQSRLSMTMSSRNRACLLLYSNNGLGFPSISSYNRAGYPELSHQSRVAVSSHNKARFPWAPTTKQGFRELPQQSRVSVSVLLFIKHSSLWPNKATEKPVASGIHIYCTVTHSHNQILLVIKVNKLNKEI